jgi:DNA replication protein DnaD
LIQPVGYFKIWRELFSKPIWQNSTPEQKTILITLLAMANFREKKWEWQGKPFECQPGQFITSLDSIAKESGKGVAIKNVRTALERFEKLEFLANESTKTGRLITILNWELYQGDVEEGGKAPGIEQAKTGQRPGKQQAPKEEGKEDKKVKKDIYIKCQHLSMTKEEYGKLVSEHGEQAVKNKLEYAENYAKLKNYKSLYLTLNNWLKADKKKEGANGTGTTGQAKPTSKFDKSKFLAPGTF